MGKIFLPLNPGNRTSILCSIREIYKHKTLKGTSWSLCLAPAKFYYFNHLVTPTIVLAWEKNIKNKQNDRTDQQHSKMKTPISKSGLQLFTFKAFISKRTLPASSYKCTMPTIRSQSTPLMNNTHHLWN